MPEQFPLIGLRQNTLDRNPAIRLFGRRLFVDQTVPELLLEFLLVAVSKKRIAGEESPFSTILPEMNRLHSWPTGCGLEYSPKVRLNLKLFAFLGASKLDTRHESHRQHYRALIRDMRSPEKLNPGSLDEDEVLKTLENLFLGFQSVGGQRTWCAASFLPISRQLIADESIWRETAARAKGVENWESALEYFSHTQQVFLARSGALLYLQVCNALRQDQADIQSWADAASLSLTQRESSPSELLAALERALESVLDSCPETVGRLADFLDTGVDSETAKQTDFQAGTDKPRFASCGWCPAESWPEGLLFAIELLRLCEAVIDPIERLEMLEIACAMQVLRSLCAQSARYAQRSAQRTDGIGSLGYVWAISDPAGDQTVVKQISRRNVNAVQRLIFDAVRHPDLHKGLNTLSPKELKNVINDMDKRYGHKLFLTVAKRIGLIVPKRGAGTRFVFNDRLLRFLVLSVLRPGERVTYESFKKLLLAHYGITVDDEGFASSCEWSGTSRLTTLGGKTDEWLTEMLEASGVLIRLSDSCSLVLNPFDGGEVSE
ncbi:conserved hypothetical protein [uncultured Desulfobacterium sp.]|uniref:Uncharacterized protein n=1 Tax=uncultured Desulfobacterium sp. TaxID=201089 RepID=A0A445N162_9BACT|nr:conserved hypothetical protein [uncultured Desulfobacterium sp.]